MAGTDNHSRDIFNSNPSPEALNGKLEPIIATCNVSIQTEDNFLWPELAQKLKDSRDHNLEALPPELRLPPKKRYFRFEENNVTEPSENYLDCPSSYGSQMKLPEFKLESVDQNSNSSLEKHKTGKLILLQIPTHVNQHCYKQSSVDTIEGPLDLSVNDNRTNERMNDQNTLQELDLPLTGSNLFSSTMDAPQGSVRSDIEIHGSHNDKKLQQEDSLCQQTSEDKQQELSEYPLLDYLKHETETHTTSVDLPFPKQKELEELESSIANDSLISNSPSLYSEPDLKCGKLQGHNAEVLETSSADIVAEKNTSFSLHPSAADRDSLKKSVDDGLEGEEKCYVQEMQNEIEKTNTEYIALEVNLDGNSNHFQPVLRVRNLRRKKREVTVDHFSLSFTRLPRVEQARIDPARAMKLREENNRACRKNRVKKAQKIMELEQELTRFKEIARRSNASVKC